MIGGGVRTPRVQEELMKFMGLKEVSHHLNGDEAMSFGAVYIAANYSKSYRMNLV